MVNTKIILTLAAIFLVFLVACTSLNETEQNQSETQLEDTNSILQPLQHLECGENQVLQGAQCVCSEGYKVCNKACVPQSQCCKNSDCASGICQEGVCTNPCTGKICPYNQVCQPTTGECGCKAGTKFCSKQDQCIKLDQCCDSADCKASRENRRCTDIVVSMNVCVNNDTYCKFIAKGKPAKFNVDGTDTELYFENLYEGNLVDVQINGESSKAINVPKTITIPKGTVSFDEIKVVGGYCQEFK